MTINEQLDDMKLQSKFYDSLLDKTKKLSIKWHSLETIKPKNEDENYYLYYHLFESEYHKINYENSFYTKTEQGYIYLIYERTESGKDSEITEGYGFFLQSSKGDSLYRITCAQSLLFRLRNIIVHTINPSNEQIEQDNAQKFMKNFLSDQ